MGSNVYTLGTIQIRLNYDPEDPDHPPVSFNLNNTQIEGILTLKKGNITQSFEEGTGYPLSSLLGELLVSIEEMEKKG